MPSPYPFSAGTFRVTIEGVLNDAPFSEVSGLDASVDVIEYRAGNTPSNTPQKIPGVNRYTDITLKRGLTTDNALFAWLNQVLTGAIARQLVTIILFDAASNPVWKWTLRNAWPCKWTGPTLVADSSAVAIETLVICHEGLESSPA